MSLPEDAPDEDLYQWFIGSFVGYGAAVEERPNVIRVEDKVSGPTGAHLDEPRDPRDHDRTVWIHLTREQLRSVAWAEVDIFDDTVLDVVPQTTTPVWTGLTTFQFFSAEKLDTMRPGEGHLVFDGHALRPSLVPTLPPVRSDRFWD